jgi:hypothetical protein
MGWVPFEYGASIGRRGSENGAILLDEEHELGARITLEKGGDIAPFAITCGVYGWMFHTRFCGSEAQGIADYDRMKEGLAAILSKIPRVDDPKVKTKGRLVEEAIQAFVEQFP